MRERPQIFSASASRRPKAAESCRSRRGLLKGRGARGNEGPFSEILSFVVDVAAPSVPGDLKGVSTGQTLEGIFYSPSIKPTFQWLRSVDGLVDTGDGGGEVVSYRIVVRDGAGQVSEDEVLDGDPERCGEFTCRFTIADLEADGPYTVLVTAKDSAVDLAHESEAANALFFVDTKVPDDPPPGIPDLVRVDQRDISFDATISWAQAGDPDFPEKGLGSPLLRHLSEPRRLHR